ncbi:ABC transporter substrate-binding protein, partial [Guyparkeria sp. 1SP6A2]|nr:ABC transporter substrate-binding protein [Guyparkeria sp. 1SP6A2]
NANLFYDSYARTQSAFQNSELAARGLPSEAELALLEPWREHLDPRVFSKPMPLAEPEDLRERLRRAHDLLLEAGYVYRDRR